MFESTRIYSLLTSPTAEHSLFLSSGFLVWSTPLLPNALAGSSPAVASAFTGLTSMRISAQQVSFAVLRRRVDLVRRRATRCPTHALR
jgi:hypothetical protein